MYVESLDKQKYRLLKMNVIQRANPNANGRSKQSVIGLGLLSTTETQTYQGRPIQPPSNAYTCNLFAGLYDHINPPILTLLPRLEKSRPRKTIQVYGKTDETDDSSESLTTSTCHAQYIYNRQTAPSATRVTCFTDKNHLFDDRRSRVSKIFCDLRQNRTPDDKTSYHRIDNNNITNMTRVRPRPTSRPMATKIDLRIQCKRDAYDPRPRDVVEKCERWIGTLPERFSSLSTVISVPADPITPTSLSEEEEEEVDFLGLPTRSPPEGEKT